MVYPYSTSCALSYILKQQWCLSVWAVPGRIFQTLPVPCGVLCRRGGVGGGGPVSWGISWIGNFNLLLILLAAAAQVLNVLEEFLDLGISISSSSLLLRKQACKRWSGEPLISKNYAITKNFSWDKMANKISVIVYEAESIGVKFVVQCFCAKTHTMKCQCTIRNWSSKDSLCISVKFAVQCFCAKTHTMKCQCTIRNWSNKDNLWVGSKVAQCI
jgi:hypothetical protein